MKFHKLFRDKLRWGLNEFKYIRYLFLKFNKKYEEKVELDKYKASLDKTKYVVFNYRFEEDMEGFIDEVNNFVYYLHEYHYPFSEIFKRQLCKFEERYHTEDTMLTEGQFLDCLLATDATIGHPEGKLKQLYDNIEAVKKFQIGLESFIDKPNEFYELFDNYDTHGKLFELEFCPGFTCDVPVDINKYKPLEKPKIPTFFESLPETMSSKEKSLAHVNGLNSRDKDDPFYVEFDFPKVCLDDGTSVEYEIPYFYDCDEYFDEKPSYLFQDPNLNGNDGFY